LLTQNIITEIAPGRDRCRFSSLVDMAAGGQGAPLMPLFHQSFFSGVKTAASSFGRHY
jgi:hypothetical protein